MKATDAEAAGGHAGAARLFAPAGWAGLMGWLALQPRPPEVLASRPSLAHAGGFAVLSLLLGWACRWRWPMILWLTPLAAAYAVCLEALQAFVPGRTPSAADAATNIAGLLVGLAVVLAKIRR